LEHDYTDIYLEAIGNYIPKSKSAVVSEVARPA
jgi:hypothetical protein